MMNTGIFSSKGGNKMKNLVNSTRGAAAVEFGLLAPLLFVILFGIIEFGAVLYNKAVITNVSREGDPPPLIVPPLELVLL